MINNEERRKVAEQLRSIPSVDYFGHESINPRHLWETIGFLRTVDGRIPTYEVEHLADLIDRPACHLASCEIDNGSVSWGVRCTECNERFEHVLPNEYNYCPNCGAEVIRDED